MSKQSRRMRRQKGPQFSIARALAPLSGEDEAAVCAFIAMFEKERQAEAGELQGWRITRDAKGWILECMTKQGEHLTSEHEQCLLACRALGQQMVALAMKGAPQA